MLEGNEEEAEAPGAYNRPPKASRMALASRFVPRVHAEDSGLCGLVYTDDQLVRRCRSLRKNAARRDPG